MTVQIAKESSMTHNGTFAGTSTPQPGLNGTVRRARRVLIVDDHPVVRQGLRRVMQYEDDLIVCGKTGTAGDASTAILELNPDVLRRTNCSRHTIFGRPSVQLLA
jgi:hypothetical protein